jgi:hypothetical protein
MNEIEKKSVGGGFMAKKERNENLRRYHLRYPKMTHTNLARIFKISRVRVTQILNDNKSAHRSSEQIKVGAD